MDTSKPDPKDAYILVISMICFIIGIIALLLALFISIKFESL